MHHYLTQTQISPQQSITILHTHAMYQHHNPHHLYFFNPHLQKSKPDFNPPNVQGLSDLQICSSMNIEQHSPGSSITTNNNSTTDTSFGSCATEPD
jgi:hypothetical protein